MTAARSPREPNFDPVARIYRWAEYLALGPLLAQTRFELLPYLSDRRRALVLGDGDGRFLARLLRLYPDLQAVAVDTSATMLDLLRKRCAFAPERLTILHTSALQVSPPAGTDLAVTHFFLDCFSQSDVNRLAQTLSMLPPGTLWLVSDFAYPNSPLLRPLAALFIRGLYLVFRILTGLRTTRLPDVGLALANAGFTRTVRRERLGGILYTEIWRRSGADFPH